MRASGIPALKYCKTRKEQEQNESTDGTVSDIILIKAFPTTIARRESIHSPSYDRYAHLGDPQRNSRTWSSTNGID